MNSKQLVVEFKNGAHAGTLFVELDKDAENLIRARNAQVPAARRSCYLEQGQKWRSAVSKSNIEGVDVDGYKNHCMNDQKLKWVFTEPVIEKPTHSALSGFGRHSTSKHPPLHVLALIGSMYQNMVDEQEQKRQEAVSRYLESYRSFKRELPSKNPEMFDSEASLCAVSATLSVMELIKVTVSAVRDFKSYIEYCDLLETLYTRARKQEPELPERYGQWIQALILRFHATEMKTALGQDKYDELNRQYKDIELT